MFARLRAAFQQRSITVGEFDQEPLDVDAILAPEGITSSRDAAALALPAYYRGVALRAGLIASIPLRWELDGQPQPEDATPPILRQPDPSEPRSVTIKRMVASLDMRGNAIAVLGGYDSLGFPQALKVVHPADVLAQRSMQANDALGLPAGAVEYRIAGQSYRPDEIFHARGLVIGSSVMGVSPIEAMRASLAGAAQVERYGRNFFKRNGVPSAHVKIDRPREQVDKGELRNLAREWMGMMAGGRRPVFTPKDIEITPIALSNEDSQFLETRKFSLIDIANIVGIPGYFIGAEGSSRTYSNVQDERRALIDIYLREAMEAIEDAFTALLPAGEAKFDPSSFLRLDQLGTAQALAIEMQWMTLDEIRAVQGYPPLPNGQGKVLASVYAQLFRQPDMQQRALQAALGVLEPPIERAPDLLALLGGEQ